MGELVHVCKPGTQEAELGEWRAGDRLSGHSESLSHHKQKRKQKTKEKEKKNGRKIQLLPRLRASKAKGL